MLRCLLVAVLVASVLFPVAATAQSYRNEPWYKNPILQRVRLTDMSRDVAVSPSGNQIAWANVDGISIHAVLDDGRIGGLHKRIDLPNAMRIEFTPDGNQIICANAIGDVHLIDRRDWSVRVVDVPGATNPTEIEVVTQRPEAYISYYRDPHLAVINFQEAKLVQALAIVGDTVFEHIDAVVAPAGDFVVAVGLDRTPSPGGGNGGRYIGYRLPLAGIHHTLFAFRIPMPRAACVGPDPDSMLLITTAADPLEIWSLRTGASRLSLDFDFNYPIDVANSRDGRFIVVPEMNGHRLAVISGADVRGLLDPNFDITVDQVRTHKVDLGEMTGSVVLHPTRDLAYVRSYHGDTIWTVRIGLPNV